MKVKVVDGPRAGMLIDFEPRKKTIDIPDEEFHHSQVIHSQNSAGIDDKTFTFSTYVLRKDGDEYSYHLDK